MHTLAATPTNLQDAATAYAHACAAVSGADWVSRGPPHGWSMAETTEHVTTTNSAICRIVGALRPLGDGEAAALLNTDINVHMFDGDGMESGTQSDGHLDRRG